MVKEAFENAAGSLQTSKQIKDIHDYKAILFKTPTCPNCKAAGALLDRAGISYTALNANEQKELVEKYGIKQAPTLVLVNGEGFEKYRGVSDIKGWLMKW